MTDMNVNGGVMPEADTPVEEVKHKVKKHVSHAKKSAPHALEVATNLAKLLQNEELHDKVGGFFLDAQALFKLGEEIVDIVKKAIK